MTDAMSSRQRVMQAFNHAEVDHVPLLARWWGRAYFSDKNDSWRDQFERALKTTGLGLDDVVQFEPPRMLSPDVTTTVRREDRPGERYPILFKEYHTAKGALSQIAYKTDDWPHGDQIPIFTDFLVPRSRSRKYLIETIEDVEALGVLFAEPSDELLREARERANKARNFAEKNEVLIESGTDYLGSWLDGSGLFLGDALGWLCGLENAIKFAFAKPELLQKLLDTILEWNLRHIRLISELGGSDIIVHRAWYETFWSPKLFRTFFASRIKKEIDQVHGIGSKYCYIMTSGIMPLLEPLKEMDIDILYGVDPVQGGANLREIKEQLGDRFCLWGGMNSAVTLGSGGRQNVEKAVRNAIEILSPGGGFVLAPIDQLFEDTRWENVLTMIETWSRLSRTRTW